MKISENVTYRLIHEKIIPAFKVGRIYKIPRIAVKSFIISHRNSPVLFMIYLTITLTTQKKSR
ncbi:MAG: helix-turn-helix domain-containing protein [Clostridiales bacterium]|nr:helix-turn-helix domain-containing protein [Clostridiales bacterium]